MISYITFNLDITFVLHGRPISRINSIPHARDILHYYSLHYKLTEWVAYFTLTSGLTTFHTVSVAFDLRTRPR